jgi:hypothetical protein
MSNEDEQPFLTEKQAARLRTEWVAHGPAVYPDSLATGLVLTGDVAALRQDVTRLRAQLITVTADLEDVEADNDRLRALLAQSRLPHSPDCLTTYNRAYPCSCPARRHNARIDAALGESPDALSDSLESPDAATDH